MVKKLQLRSLHNAQQQQRNNMKRLKSAATVVPPLHLLLPLLSLISTPSLLVTSHQRHITTTTSPPSLHQRAKFTPPLTKDVLHPPLPSSFLHLRGGDTPPSSPSQRKNNLTELLSDHIASNRKIVVVTGGVLSGIGKGVIASSLGVLLRGMGLRVTALKIDPYVNVDAGTMSPFEHGEVFVLDDGGECDLDLGNYERFLGVSLTRESNMSTGKIYQSVIERERVGDYLGKTVQIIPHISDAIQEWVLRVSSTPVQSSCTMTSSSTPLPPNPTTPPSSSTAAAPAAPPQVCIVELGGTLGDIESMPFVEALRQLQEQIGYKNMCFVHVSLVPVLGTPPEQKTKPTQHSVKIMRQLGLTPDFICCRGTNVLDASARRKISLFSSVPERAIISVHDVSNIYHVPLMMLEQGVIGMLARRLRIHPKGEYYAEKERGERMTEAVTEFVGGSELMRNWVELAKGVDDPKEGLVKIAIVGKYIDHGDAYASVVKALTHAAIATSQRLKIEYIDATDLLSPPSSPAWTILRSCHGMVVPGGFGSRGMEGKIAAIRYAREQGVPFLGICLGMQAAVVEYCRNVAGREGAGSCEFEEREGLLEERGDDVVIFMPEGDRERMGGTMRLGARETILKKDSLAHRLYSNRDRIMERHRHRYEINPTMVPDLERLGLHFVGRNTDGSGERMEVIELSEDVHPFFIGTQFHPEFMSRPGGPSPVFLGLLEAGKVYRRNSEGEGVEKGGDDEISL